MRPLLYRLSYLADKGAKHKHLAYRGQVKKVPRVEPAGREGEAPRRSVVVQVVRQPCHCDGWQAAAVVSMRGKDGQKTVKPFHPSVVRALQRDGDFPSRAFGA